MRQCKKCKEWKDESEFYRTVSRTFIKNGKKYTYDNYYRPNCKSCMAEHEREKYKCASAEWKKSKQRESLFRMYGLIEDDYNRMFDEQKGCCAICGRHQSELKKPLYIDHDHKTGKVRKLLCQHCNSLLGFAGDSINALEAAIRYLRGSC